MLQSACDAEPPELLIDLGETTFFGGEFLGLLCECFHEIERRRGQFALCDVRAELRDELHATKLDGLWAVYATQDEALEAMMHRAVSVP
jgi:anti-anti-sigma factor